MAKLLQLLVLAATAACTGYASALSTQRTGVSFTLDESTLRPMALAAQSRHPEMHRMKATARGLLDDISVEIARAILHLSGDGATATTATESFGATLAALAATDKRTKTALEQMFVAPGSNWLDSAHQHLKGSWRKDKLRSHAKVIDDFAAGRSTDTAAYELARTKVTRFLRRFRKNIDTSATADSSFIPFELLPQWRADAKIGAPATTITGGWCYPSYSVSAAQSGANSSHIAMTVTAQGTASSALCAEQILFIAGGIKFHLELFSSGTPSKTVSIDVADVIANPAANWFLGAKGVRSYIIATDSILSTIGSLVDTLTMLAGFASQAPPAAVLDANLKFINEYIQDSGNSPRMGPLAVPRAANNTVVANFDPSNIQSGDLLMLLRRDGIDPMIGWGEGSMAGHSVVAIRTGPSASELQICESTTLDGYWPDNGIQCHTWDRWVQLCVNAGQNVVLVPLDAATRAKFDTNKALAFFNTNKGLDYGYSSFLFGWLDTAKDNFPCTPSSNFKTCLTVEFAEQLGITLDGVFGTDHINFFRQSLAHRTGQWTTSPATTPNVLQTLQYAQTKMSMGFAELIQVIEQDSWLYQTTRNQGTDIIIGKSMVCCVFVCNMWKAGGVFDSLGGNFSCAEQTLWDLYSMKQYDAQRMGDNRPSVCKQADPTNPLCQLMGDITLHLVPDVNTRALYPNMGEKCAAIPPNYVRPAGC